MYQNGINMHLVYFCVVERFCEHIKKLLAQHEYAVVPGLGGFVVQHQSAIIFADKITAPADTVGFNPLMLHGDGLLALQIARESQISYRMALQYIDNEVNAIKSRLAAIGEVDLPGLGVLHRNSGGLFFVPVLFANFLPNNLGIDDIYISAKHTLETSQNKRTISVSFQPGNTFRYAASIFLVVGLFLFSSKLSDTKKSNQAGIASLSTIKTMVSATPELSSVSVDSIAINTPDSTENYHYHVIVASLPSLKTAESYCTTLKQEYHTDSAHVLPPVSNYRVAIRSFASKADAVEYMEHLRTSDPQFKNAWVLHK